MRIFHSQAARADAESWFSFFFRAARSDRSVGVDPRTGCRKLAVVVGALLTAMGPVACSVDSAKEQAESLGGAAKIARELTPGRIASRIEQAGGLIEAQQYQAAVDLLQPVVSLQNVPSSALERYGRALLMTEKPSLALWPLARAAEGAPPESEVTFLHIRALLAGGDPAAAIRELDRLIALVPEVPRLIRLRAQAHRRQLAYGKALDDLDLLIELVPDELAAREARIELLRELDLVQEARETIAELGLRIAAQGGTLAARGRHCASAALFEHQQGEAERARRMLLECLEAYPFEPDVVLPWVLFLDAEGDAAEATAALEEAVSGLGQAKLRLRVALADRYAASGRREDAARELDQAAQDLDSHQPLLSLADHRVAWSDFEGAREAVNRAVERQVGRAPGSSGFSWSAISADYRFAFGDILIRAGQFDEVEELIESLEEDSGEAVFPLLLRARLALEQGAPAEALSLFEESFRFWPSNVGARYLAGRAAMEIGEFDRGMSFYQDAFRADPTASDAGRVLARMQVAHGGVGAAADSLSTLLGQTSDDPEAVRLFANLASRIGAFEVAEGARLQLAEQLGRVDQALADQAAEVWARQGREAAIAHLENASLFEQPDYHESLFLWFRLKAEGGEVDRAAALERLGALRTAASDSAGIELVWARVHRSMGDPDKAIAASNQAVDRDPKLLEAGIELGRLLLEKGEWPEAESAFQRVLDAERGRLGAAMGLADVAAAAGRRDEAEGRYRKALVEHPWHGRAARALARIGFERGDLGDQTLVWARWAARFNEGETAGAATLLAGIRLARGEPSEAATALAVAMESGTGADPRLYYLMGRALIELDDRARAALAIEDALRLGDFPEAHEARELLTQLRSGVDR